MERISLRDYVKHNGTNWEYSCPYRNCGQSGAVTGMDEFGPLLALFAIHILEHSINGDYIIGPKI